MADLDQKSQQDLMHQVDRTLETKLSCPHCSEAAVEDKEVEWTIWTVILPFLLIWGFGYFYAIISYPFLMWATMRYRFYCSRCKKMTMKGNYFVIIAQRTSLSGVLILPPLVPSTFLFVFLFLQLVAILPDTWTDYQGKCGKAAILSDYEQALSQFRSIYQGNDVDWSGNLQLGWYLEQAETRVFERYRGCLHVMMDFRTPPESDINLCSSSKNLILISKNWTRGVKIAFSARFDSMCYNNTSPYLDAYYLQVISWIPFEQKRNTTNTTEGGQTFLQVSNSP